MFKNICLAIVLAFTFGVGTAFASDGLDVTLSCPLTASVASTPTLNVTVRLKNWSCHSMTVSRYMTVLVANSANTLGGAGLFGPFARTRTALTVPAANCTTCTNDNGCPGTVANFTAPIITPIPVTSVGKMAIASLSYITATGQEIGGGSCLVAIAR